MVTEESAKETVKTIAQGMPADAVYLWLLTRALFLLRTRLRVQRASGIPCALCSFEGGSLPTTRAICAARMRSHVSPVAMPRQRVSPLANDKPQPGIQHAEASRLKHNRFWNTGSPVKPGDDGRGDGGQLPVPGSRAKCARTGFPFARKRSMVRPWYHHRLT
jgi:hypothetical protein